MEERPMKVGVGLPFTMPAQSGPLILEWARRADAGPFSSLSVIDRIVYPNYDPLMTLSAAAAVTRRVRLMTAILLAPLHNAGVLAKQAATLDAFSGGRLTLGFGVGRKEDDFRATSVSFRGRGKRFEEQLAWMKRIWAGEGVAEGVGPIGPAPARPGGPELLIGGSVPVAIRRVGRWADGYLMGSRGLDPEGVLRLRRIVEDSWQAAGRAGQPRFVASTACALGPRAPDLVRASVGHYYPALGPGELDKMVKDTPTSPEAVRAVIQFHQDLGTDEVTFRLCSSDLEQLERLAQVVE
jgi:alkanesulfonate monooxygenase SsuD/methylene tetrahydromethanopterin reductase-like flavin-dependent oxidoreductase (luciferase family)